MLQLIIPPVVILVAGVLLVVFLSRATAQQKKQAHAVTIAPSVATSPVDVLRRAGGDASQRIKDKLQDTISQPVRRTMARMTRTATTGSMADNVVTLRKRSMVSEKMEDTAHRDEEEVTLMRAIEQHPHDSKAYEQLGDYYMEREQFEDARDCYKYVLRLDPRHRRAQVAMKNLDRVL